MTEKELEKLFKTKLGQQEYQYNPAAWNAMEKMLGQSDVRGGFYYWRSVAAILIFGLLVGGIIGLQEKTINTNTPSAGTTTEQDAAQSGTIAAEEISPLESEIKQEVITPDPVTSVQETESPTSDQVATENVPASSPSDAGAASEVMSTLIAAGENNRTEGREALSQDNVDNVFASNSFTWDPYENIDVDARGTNYMASLNDNPELASNGNFTPDALNKFRGRHELFFVGGTVLNESYNNNDLGVGWHAGLMYQYHVNTNLVLSAGLNYNVINKVGLVNEIDSTFYHFGSERIEIEEVSQRLQYLELPVYASWKFKSRHQVGAGFYVSRLMSVTLENTKTRYSFGTETDVQNEVLEGQNDNYYNFDYGMSLMYFYQVTPDMSLGLEMRRGFQDITRNVGNVYQNEHLNMNTRLSLRYRIL